MTGKTIKLYYTRKQKIHRPYWYCSVCVYICFFCILTYLTYSTSSTREHRVNTRSLHLFLSLDELLLFASLEVLPIFFHSCSSPLLHVFFGLPFFRCPFGFQSGACLITLLSLFLNVCPPLSDLKLYGLLIGPIPGICTRYFFWPPNAEEGIGIDI